MCQKLFRFHANCKGKRRLSVNITFVVLKSNFKFSPTMINHLVQVSCKNLALQLGPPNPPPPKKKTNKQTNKQTKRKKQTNKQINKKPKQLIAKKFPSTKQNNNKKTATTPSTKTTTTKKNKLQNVFFNCKDEALYCIVLYCIVLYCIVLYCIVLYCIVLYWLCEYDFLQRMKLNKTKSGFNLTS